MSELNEKKAYIGSSLFFVLFIVFTILSKTVDVEPIGPEGSLVGFSNLNHAFNFIFSFNNFYYEASEILGYAALGVCFGFALFGLSQLVKRKSLKKVDKEIYLLAGFYAIVLGFYALFEVIVINYRPIILDAGEGLEASYPSSHTMLGICVFFSAAAMFQKYLWQKKMLCNIVTTACIAAMVLTIVFRAFSGVHWITDICGGCLLSTALICLFGGAYISIIKRA